MSKTEEAVTTLTELGLTEYESRCFVAPTRLSSGTAKEVSQVSDVPRSRVYDTIERLGRKGLVDVQQSEPREYRAVPTEAACRRLKEDYDSRIDAAENALSQVEEPESSDDEGMWSINQSEQVVDRIVTFLEAAEKSVYLLIATDEVLDRRILEGLQSAAERGVHVLVEVPTEDVANRVRDAVPGAVVVVAGDLQSSEPVYSEWPGQLLMVDRSSVVAAGRKESDLPDVVNETAVWTYGHDHGFAVWTRKLLEQRRAARAESGEKTDDTDEVES
ncbi:TrmB family transcriptional regulator [Halobacteria archaeon AArc-m2/3/4]|uniref:TrmB family transcriptional regulator n=1 Tax=Natronoglomus mannanivorans TaxID=2979990 RepID=A0ABT2QBM8_9EURY|nr:TrmB family transcriptional regulator [Halobacteria archaeon AArc-m2/3/4]